jgi:AraC-like DNA-binding protein
MTPITYSRLLARELNLDENGQRELLAGTGLTPHDLFRLEQGVDSNTQLIITRNALRLSGNPAFGLHWGSRLHLSAHGPLGLLLANSPNMGKALDAIEHFHALRLQHMNINQQRVGDRLVQEIEFTLPMDEVGIFSLEALMVSLQRAFELVLGRHLTEAEIGFAYAPPAHAERYGDYLHSHWHFNAGRNYISVPACLAATSNPFSDPALFSDALRRCEQISATQKERAGWAQKVAQLLRSHPGQLWSQAEVAAQLEISSRSLIRYLKAEGTAYQALLDAELGRQARACLDSGRYTVEGVALTLGYQEVSAFRRAFKRWFGMSPADYLAGRS